ncbi:MAG: dTMP kinase, partial [Actinomycetota bacterium]|nr:dTMP kinase [Actinomycetota bacterium]
MAFEGGEGAGKSTQARRLASRIDAVITREPGGTDLGSKLRRLLLEPGQAVIGARAETLLMAADRAQHLDEVVLPALRSGRHVVSDRTAFSSLAYQGGGRDLGVDEVRAINEFALCGRWPDAVVLLDVPRVVGHDRLGR